jgi:hypothetical protein
MENLKKQLEFKQLFLDHLYETREQLHKDTATSLLINYIEEEIGEIMKKISDI